VRSSSGALYLNSAFRVLVITRIIVMEHRNSFQPGSAGWRRLLSGCTLTSSDQEDLTIMKPAAGIAICVLAGAAWAQSDGEFKAREWFQIQAPAVKTTPAKNPNAGKPKPVLPPSGKPAVDKPATDAPVEVVSNDAVSHEVAPNKNPTAPDNVTRIQPAAYAPLALRYTILQKKGDAYEEVDPNTEFHTGDRIRVRVETNGPAYLYIVEGGASGQWQVLFPAKAIFGGKNLIEPGRSCTIPPENALPFYFDETPGVEKVSLVLSRTPEADLEKLIYEAGDPTRKDDHPKMIMAQNIPEAVLGHVRDQVLARDLVVDNSPPASDGTKEKAVYAATPDKTADARVFVDLSLHHVK
jgi:hypothetical protein